MEKKRRESDLSTDLYLSLYGNNRKLKSEKIKAYVLYKKLTESIKTIDNFVVASSDTNEISVSSNKQIDSKVFSYDKVFCSDSPQNEMFDSFIKPSIQDIIMGLNSYIIICRLADSPIAKSSAGNASFLNMDPINCCTESMLKQLILYVKNEDSMDSSLHASYFGVHDDKIIDFLNNYDESNNVKVFEATSQTFEIQDLTEKALVDEKDIAELISKQVSHNLMSYRSFKYTVLSISLITKNVNCDGFEFIKVGKLFMVELVKWKNNFLADPNKSFEDWLLKLTDNGESSNSPKPKMFDILGPAFGGSAKTCIVLTLSSVLHSLENDLKVLQFTSEAQKFLNSPEINLELVIPNSLKEYSEEIQELQKDLCAISKGSGVLLDNHMYRFYKNSLSLENKKIKTFNSNLILLTDAVNAKKQRLINLHAATGSTKSEIKDLENAIEMLKRNLEKMRCENNVKQKSSMKADEILAMKQMKISYELCMKKLKSKQIKINEDCEELTKSVYSLKGDMISLSCSKSAEQTSLKSTLELLMVDMNATLLNFQTLQQDLLVKLNNLSNIDALLKMWQQNSKNLSKFSSFIHENAKSINNIKLMSSSSVSLQATESEITDIIRNSRIENRPVLSYYFQKIEVFCNSSFKILDEITCQLDVIQSCYKAELKAIGAVICSSSKSYKKFICDISSVLKSYKQYFEEQEKDLSEIISMGYCHHTFKKNFDENIGAIKHSLLTLKQMCMNHNDTTFCKWNEIQKDCNKATEKHGQLSEHLSMIHKEMVKYIDNLSHQKFNALEYSPMKDKTENVESKASQLLQIHKEMKAIVEETSEVYQKGANKEVLEVEKCLDSQKEVVEKYFDTLSFKLKTNAQSFFDNLRSVRKTFTDSKDELKNNLESLSSSMLPLIKIYDSYQANSKFILEKSERSFKIMPVISEDKIDINPDFETLILDEWKVSTSTPNVPEEKILDVPYEKEKLLSRMKSLAEQKIAEKPNICDLNSEENERKNPNISGMSLPNLNTHLKVCNRKGKNFSVSCKTKK